MSASAEQHYRDHQRSLEVGRLGVWEQEKRVPERLDILTEVLSERAWQIAKGYDTGHDDEHGLMHLAQFAKERIWPMTKQGYRKRLLQAAAIIVAMVESLDRASA